MKPKKLKVGKKSKRVEEEHPQQIVKAKATSQVTAANTTSAPPKRSPRVKNIHTIGAFILQRSGN